MMTSPYQLFDVRGKIAVVTGGSGQLGSAYIDMFLAAGAKVVSFDIRKPAKKKNFLGLLVDVTDRKSVEKGLREVVRQWGVPHILVNNAGVDTPPSNPTAGRVRFEDFPEAEWDRVMEVNLKGMLICCQVVGGAMADRKQGSIVNIGSIYGLVSPDQRIYKHLNKKGQKPFFKPVPYSVTKSGVLNLTRYLATYWAPQKIRVNTLVPGGIYNNQDPQFLKEFSGKVPLGRMGRAQELVGGMLYLTSEASSYVTGSTLVIDGGYTSW